jgi:hypothetical protein
VKRDRLHYDHYKRLVDTKFKNPLRQCQVYDVPLYTEALANQEIIVKRIPAARPRGKALSPISEDLLNSTLLDMKDIYLVDQTMVHYCEQELITNSNEFFQDWIHGETLAQVYYTGFLVCGQMEGYAYVEGHVTIRGEILRYPLYEGVMKMNMRHAEEATYYYPSNTIDQWIEYKELFGHSIDDNVQDDPYHADFGPMERYVGGFVANRKEGLGRIFEKEG